jgi:pimeloyl-ACP methyl ester carboxylesterase
VGSAVVRRGDLRLLATGLAAVVLAASLGARTADEAAPILREELHLVPDARLWPHLLLMTLGGPNYCVQLQNLANHVDASLLCADYGRDRYETPSERTGRLEDWGDPAYDAAAARLPAQLERSGVLVSKLVVIGVSYSGFANAELVATHPELHAAALIVVDSFLDLTARFDALPGYHSTRSEMEAVLGGTPETAPQAYAARSPSHHLDSLAAEVRRGMRFVDVWSLSASEKHEFLGATCSLAANARWLGQLATRLGAPVTGYVTYLRHAYALWDYGRGLLGLAGLSTAPPPRTAHPLTFKPGRPPPNGSSCA